VPQKDIFRLEIAVDDVNIPPCQKLQSSQDLLGKFPNQIEGNSIELGVFQEFV
jgi:hypothetical protein